MQRLVTFPWITAGVALVSAGIVTVTPVPAPPSTAHVFDIQLTDAEEITLDLVRHGQSTDDVNGILGTLPPGAHLSPLGFQQADDLVQSIQQEFPGGIAGIYASELIRTQETADPLAQALGLPVQVLPDLNEIPAGIFEEHPRDLISEANFFGPMAAWVLGDLFVSEPGTSYNGATFEEQVNHAVDTIYNNTIAGNGPMTDVAVSSGGDIDIWTLMNVKNPDFAVYIDEELKSGLGPPPNAGQTILQGDPTDGWTLVSYDGTPVPQTPNLLVGLFVDYRDVAYAEQLALYNIEQAIQGGNQAGITAALQTGYDQVAAALQQFPQSVMDTLSDSAATAGTAAGASVVDGLAGAI